MSTDQLYAIGGGLAAVLAGAHAAIQTVIANRAKKEVKQVTEKAEQHLVSAAVSEQHKATAESMERQANDWHARFIKNDADLKGIILQKEVEFSKQRDYWHGKAEADQALLTRYQMELSELKGKTDLTPLVDYLKHRVAVDDQILSTLKTFSETLMGLNGSMTQIYQRLDNLIDKKQQEN